jgi:nucleoside phosphorylase
MFKILIAGMGTGQFRVVPTKILTLMILLTAPLVYAEDIAFFYALDADLQALKAEASIARQPIKVGDHNIQVLNLARHKIYAVKMGSGAVETAISAQALLAKFRCDRAFSLGPIGALSDELQIGKWYRVSSVTAYQKGSWTTSGFQLNKASAMSLPGEKESQLALPAFFQNLKPVAVASGEIFIASNNYRQQLRETTGAGAVDMNLFGLVSVCSNHRVPLINWRIVSDKADDNAGEDFRKFTQTYDGAGGKALAELIRNLPPNPNSPQSYPELEKLLKDTAQP